MISESGLPDKACSAAPADRSMAHVPALGDESAAGAGAPAPGDESSQQGAECNKAASCATTQTDEGAPDLAPAAAAALQPQELAHAAWDKFGVELLLSQCGAPAFAKAVTKAGMHGLAEVILGDLVSWHPS